MPHTACECETYTNQIYTNTHIKPGTSYCPEGVNRINSNLIPNVQRTSQSKRSSTCSDLMRESLSDGKVVAYVTYDRTSVG